MSETTSIFIIQFAKWWQFWRWKLMRHPMEIRGLAGKQIPVLLWPEELVSMSELRPSPKGLEGTGHT